LATESSPITSQNTITLVDDDEVVDGSGYESMVNAVSKVEFFGGDDSGDDISATMTLGYANDLVGSTLVNPLGHTGLSYCMCLALMAGCDPKQSGAVIPASPIKTAAFELDGDSSDSTDYELENYIAETSRSNSADTPLFVEGTPALKAEYTALGVQTLAAFSLTGETTTIDSQREVDAILALAKGLSSKLDKCAPVNIITALRGPTSAPSSAPSAPPASF
jgi:hypothetical protein